MEDIIDVYTNRKRLITMNNLLEVKNVNNRFDKKQVLKNVSFSLSQGHTLCILGESGSGKSTLLRCIDGLIDFEGDILYDGKDVKYLLKNDVLYLRSNISLIFQNAKGSLNPYKKVQWIMEEGLKIRGVNKEERINKIHQMCKTLSFDLSLLNRYPKELSGGEAQRVVIICCLLLEPKLLLLDEPVSALDQMIATKTLNLLKEIQEKFNLTYIFVTHDLNVCKYVSDYTIVFKDGEIVEYNKTSQIFSNPINDYTKELLSV